MELKKAQGCAHYFMCKHNLPSDWKFRWQDKKCSLGTCSYVDKEIRLSKWFVELNVQSEVVDTILHEIAHALSYERYGKAGKGHGKLWKKICKEVGAIPKARCKSKLNQPKNHHKYIDTCSCGITYKRHRLRSSRGYRCPKCLQNLFVEQKNIVVFRG